MIETTPPSPVAEDFVSRYLGEFDYRYAEANLPVDPAFYSVVERAIQWVGAGAAGALGKNAYERVKARILSNSRMAEAKRKKKDIIIRVQPAPGTGHVVLGFGATRPAFHIQKGSQLWIRDLTIQFVGTPLGMIREELAPSFFPTNVTWVQVPRRQPPPVYDIRSPLWVGAAGKNPYDKRDRGGGVVVFD